MAMETMTMTTARPFANGAITPIIRMLALPTVITDRVGLQAECSSAPALGTVGAGATMTATGDVGAGVAEAGVAKVGPTADMAITVIVADTAAMEAMVDTESTAAGADTVAMEAMVDTESMGAVEDTAVVALMPMQVADVQATVVTPTPEASEVVTATMVVEASTE